MRLLSAAVDWLVEPGEQPRVELDQPAVPVAIRARPVVAVTGVRPGAGVTTVARALGVELARRDPGGACTVTGGVGARRSLGTSAATRLARSLDSPSCGHLALVDGHDPAELAAATRGLCPLVIDVADPALAGSAAACADVTVLVCDAGAEPALGSLVARALARVGPEPLIVLSRPGPAESRWAGRATVEVPASRVAAKLAARGRDTRGGPFASAVARLADLT